ncbi:zinc finger MYM-type protein 1-like [Astyanax mexicanus]|uniref:Zinc finger MYM-type protein 1-like n=1 Tax=Astyanax mexicanus TaxID=7994 RepID=A0A8T2MG81_ASTMX|nr:zinc finger MYM-type protein 1-like [Astyanax mexicanus]
MDRVYCEPCWLFSDRMCLSHHPSWTVGINDWQGLSAKIKKHESSRAHLAACVVFDTWKNDLTVDAQLDSEYKSQVRFWTDVLMRITDVTLTLASCNLAFRGHREKVGELNSGNFLSVIDLLARYDPVLRELLDKKSNVNYLSPSIQNELIALLSQRVHDEIVSEIKEAEFYSVIMDTTQDLSKVDQLSQVFRYVTVRKDEADNAIAVDINESFLGFQNISDQTAQGLETKITELIQSKGLPLHKCRGQGYDGASTMSGIYSGVQKRILDKEPNAVYVHCAAHNLNLVLNDACQHITEIKEYYDILQRLYVFFSQSIKRWELLENHLKSKPTLKRLCPTRWASRRDALYALRFRYADILQALTKITLRSKKSDERTEAMGLLKAMEAFEFVMMTVIQEKILETINIVSQVLQKKDVDLLQAASLLGNATCTLAQLRDQFDNLKCTAQGLASSWGIRCNFRHKRTRRIKRHFDELTEDQRLTNPEEIFKVNGFYMCIDTVVSQVRTRFHGMDSVTRKFQFLCPTELLRASDEALNESAQTLAAIYNEDLSSEFSSQLLSFRNALGVTDVATALKLFLTIPVTVASAERSFSKLKMIKNYLRSTMSQDRLSGLAMLSIESQRARRMDLTEIVKEFAQKNVRRRGRFGHC